MRFQYLSLMLDRQTRKAYHFQFSKLFLSNLSPPPALGNNRCPYESLVVLKISMTTPLGLKILFTVTDRD